MLSYQGNDNHNTNEACSSSTGSGLVGGVVDPSLDGGSFNPYKVTRSGLWTVPLNRPVPLRINHNSKAPSIASASKSSFWEPSATPLAQGVMLKQGPTMVMGSGSGSVTLYGKKERATRKKGKSVAAGDGKGKKESAPGVVPLLHLVPVKRLKGTLVSATSDPSTSSATCSSDENSSRRATPTTSISNSQRSEEAAATTPAAINQTKAINNKRLSGIPVFKRPSPLVATIASSLGATNSSSSSCSLSSYAVAGPSSSKVGGPGALIKSSTVLGVTTKISSAMVARGASAGGAMGNSNTAKRGSGETGGQGGGSSGSVASSVIKLKNKRSLKQPDALTALKRKKSRAKSVWH